MKNKKAQVHMLETIAVFLIFFIIVIIGFIFYVKVMKGSVEIEKEEARQLEAITVAQIAMFLPEVQCSEEGIVKSDCIDILKLNAVLGIINDNEIYYFSKLGYSEVVINEVYPESRSWVLYNKPLAGFEDNITTHLPISIFNATERDYSFGVMQVNVYLK